MDEQFEVIVQQTTGVIEWNFEQLKKALSLKMAEYDGLVYTEDDVKIAKSDLATLRKLKKEISDKRIEIKNKCLEPYGIIEAQAGELTELIDKPITMIDGQLSEYEKERRANIKKIITAYMDSQFSELPPRIAEKLKAKLYDEKWENVSTSRKRWEESIRYGLKTTLRDIESLESGEEEFREVALEAYGRNLDIKEALDEIIKAQRQKELILARERERIAQEERAKAEAEARIKIEEEKKKAEEELRKKLEESKKQITPLDVPEGVKTASKDIEATIPKLTTQNSEKRQIEASEDREAEIHTLRIRATASQMKKIKGYIEYCGAVYREA